MVYILFDIFGIENAKVTPNASIYG